MDLHFFFPTNYDKRMVLQFIPEDCAKDSV